jgi:biotin operon repressor
MTDGKKAASLNPDVREEPETGPSSGSDPKIIDQLLGPGVTIVASEDTHLRFKLQEQMAVSIATGQKFLGVFDVFESPVLFIQHGRADLEAMKARLTRSGEIPSSLDIRSDFQRIGEGAEKRVENMFLSGKTYRVIFLGDYSTAKGGFDQWYGNYITSQEKPEKPKDLLTLQYLNRKKAREEIRGLREVAIKHKVSIVLGHDLTTQGKLRNREVLHYHDTEIHIRFIKKDGIYRLEVAPGSPYVETNSWDLILDEKDSRFLPARSPEHEKPKSQTKELALSENDKAILRALSEGKVMSLADLAQATGIKRPTVHKRLKALQTGEKGARVVSFPGEGKTIYFINPHVERDW